MNQETNKQEETATPTPSAFDSHRAKVKAAAEVAAKRVDAYFNGSQLVHGETIEHRRPAREVQSLSDDRYHRTDGGNWPQGKVFVIAAPVKDLNDDKPYIVSGWKKKMTSCNTKRARDRLAGNVNARRTVNQSRQALEHKAELLRQFWFFVVEPRQELWIVRKGMFFCIGFGRKSPFLYVICYLHIVWPGGILRATGGMLMKIRRIEDEDQED